MDTHRIIRAAWVDDEVHNLDFGRRQMELHFPEITCQYVDNPRLALALIQEEPVDLLFLDIQMPELNGFQLLEALPQPLPAVIFITAFDEYAIKAIRFSALDYLLKPVDVQLWRKATEKAIDHIRQNREQAQLQSLIDQYQRKQWNTLALPSLDRIDFVKISDIIRCEGQNNYTRIHTSHQQYLVSRTLKDYEEMLADHGFIRVHLSHLIQVRQVKTLKKKDGLQLIMSDDTPIPVARSRRDEVLRALGV